MKRLEVGEKVEVLADGQRGVVVSVANAGMLGQVVTTSGARFTVCVDDVESVKRGGGDSDELDRLFGEVAGKALGAGGAGSVIWSARAPRYGEVM